MPVEGDARTFQEFIMPIGGVNLRSSPLAVRPDQALLLENFISLGGLVRRTGYAKFETDEVTTGKKITGLHKFYQQDGTSQLLVGSGANIKYHDGSDWVSIDATRTVDALMHMETWGPLDKVYVGNGVEEGLSWDGSTAVTLTGTNRPTKPIQFLAYQDRLLHIDKANPGQLGWSGSFSDTTWEPLANTSVRPDTELFGMIVHSASNASVGVDSKVLIAGSNGMYLFRATDMRPPNITTGDYRLDQLSTKVGCNSPWTMQWTPRGTIYLGMDRQVYLLPFDSLNPIPISDNIRSEGLVNGIENTPASQLPIASAVYHNGFYKLSLANSGASINNRQWWLDVNNLKLDQENRTFGPWFGPMTGIVFSAQITQDGPGDGGELFGGEGDGTTGSFVYQGSFPGIYKDSGSDIVTQWRTYLNPLGEKAVNKSIHQLEFEVSFLTGNITIDYHDFDGVKRTSDILSITTSGVLYGAELYGSFNYSGLSPSRHRFPVNPAINTRFLSLAIKNTGGIAFEIYTVRVQVEEGTEGFE